MHEPAMISYESIMVPYFNIILFPYISCVHVLWYITMEWLKAASPYQLKPWNIPFKPALVASQYDTTILTCLISYLKTYSCHVVQYPDLLLKVILYRINSYTNHILIQP